MRNYYSQVLAWWLLQWRNRRPDPFALISVGCVIGCLTFAAMISFGNGHAAHAVLFIACALPFVAIGYGMLRNLEYLLDKADGDSKI